MRTGSSNSNNRTYLNVMNPLKHTSTSLLTNGCESRPGLHPSHCTGDLVRRPNFISCLVSGCLVSWLAHIAHAPIFKVNLMFQIQFRTWVLPPSPKANLGISMPVESSGKVPEFFYFIPQHNHNMHVWGTLNWREIQRVNLPAKHGIRVVILSKHFLFMISVVDFLTQ